MDVDSLTLALYNDNKLAVKFIIACVAFVIGTLILKLSGASLESFIGHIFKEFKELILVGSYVYRLDAMISFFTFVIILCILLDKNAAQLLTGSNDTLTQFIALIFSITAFLIFGLMSMWICKQKN